MRRLFLLLLIAIATGLLLIKGVELDTGYVRIAFNHWLIETNLWTLLALTVVFSICLIIAMSAFNILGSGSGNLLRWFRNRPLIKANKDTEKGLLAFLEGNWLEAHKLLTRSADKARTPLVNILAAANAASRFGDSKESSRLLKSAHELEGGSELAASLTQARLLVESERYEAAIGILEKLNKSHPKHRFILQLLQGAYRAQGNWEKVIYCITTRREEGFIDKELSWKKERKAWANLFSDGINNATKSSNEEHSEYLSELWKRVPNKLRFDEKIIYSYTRELLKLKRHSEVETLLRKTLDKSWSENLVDAYGHTQGSDATEQLLHAERWLKERPNSPRLLLALGRLSLKAELWGKAYDYFKASQQQQASTEASAELCRLAASLNKPEQELRTLTLSLMQQLNLPELPQPKS